jgi:hypothetical protein
MRKDLGICLEEAKRNGACRSRFYAEVQKMGGAGGTP